MMETYKQSIKHTYDDEWEKKKKERERDCAYARKESEKV